MDLTRRPAGVCLRCPVRSSACRRGRSTSSQNSWHGVAGRSGEGCHVTDVFECRCWVPVPDGKSSTPYGEEAGCTQPKAFSTSLNNLPPGAISSYAVQIDRTIDVPRRFRGRRARRIRYLAILLPALRLQMGTAKLPLDKGSGGPMIRICDYCM